MARHNIYFKDKIENEIREYVMLERQNGASESDVNFSSVVNELTGLGLMLKKHQEGKKEFDLKTFNQDMIRKVSGTREGMSIVIAMLTEMYLNSRGGIAPGQLEDMMDANLTAMSTAEDKAESRHFLKEEE
ncbi:conjugal transfer protein [bacteria symbiont BFo1 of Frankliniella occidentalis]|nr:conjugal transfer protein [bacteria symbiont BFo1 of Frankliniella occidentalis]KYP82418.1 conjugal transfer protein [bacteria symbiont BFo1 of Frankliniella occidentalis]